MANFSIQKRTRHFVCTRIRRYLVVLPMIVAYMIYTSFRNYCKAYENNIIKSTMTSGTKEKGKSEHIKNIRKRRQIYSLWKWSCVDYVYLHLLRCVMPNWQIVQDDIIKVYNWIIYISSCSKFATWRPLKQNKKKHANINLNQFVGGLAFSRNSWIDYVKAEPWFDLALEEHSCIMYLRCHEYNNIYLWFLFDV
jgi:hypothetical protein